MSKRKRSAGSPYQMRTVPARPDPRQQALRAFQAGRLDTAISVWSNLSGSDPGVRAALAEAHFRRALTQSGTARVADLRHAVELAPGQLRYQYSGRQGGTTVKAPRTHPTSAEIAAA